MTFRNRTALQSTRLLDMCLGAIAGWRHDGLTASFRNSRGADYSGSCHYVPPRIFVNIGPHNRYPYLIDTHIAPARTGTNCWWREVYRVVLADAYQLALFIFMHEFYHYLVRRARRNRRQKEGRCDRFATRTLVDFHGASVLDAAGRPVAREQWDIQDLDGFVRTARDRTGSKIPSLPFDRPPAAIGARSVIGR